VADRALPIAFPGIDPMHASARHQALHRFVANTGWSDEAMLRRVCQRVVPQMDFSQDGW